MPIVISDKEHKFKGTFSGWSTAWQALKTLQRAKNDLQIERTLLIDVGSGRVKIEDRSFCRCNQAAFARELRKQPRMKVFDAEGKVLLYTLWLSPIDEIYESGESKK